MVRDDLRTTFNLFLNHLLFIIVVADEDQTGEDFVGPTPYPVFPAFDDFYDVSSGSFPMWSRCSQV